MMGSIVRSSLGSNEWRIVIFYRMWVGKHSNLSFRTLTANALKLPNSPYDYTPGHTLILKNCLFLS